MVHRGAVFNLMVGFLILTCSNPEMFVTSGLTTLVCWYKVLGFVCSCREVPVAPGLTISVYWFLVRSGAQTICRQGMLFIFSSFTPMLISLLIAILASGRNANLPSSIQRSTGMIVSEVSAGTAISRV